MKLVVAIVNASEEAELTAMLNKNGYRVTKLASTGTFLRKGNSTLLMGIDDSRVTLLLDMLKSHSQHKKIQMIADDERKVFLENSGIVVLVLNVEQFEHF